MVSSKLFFDVKNPMKAARWPTRHFGEENEHRNGTCRTDAPRSPWAACYPGPAEREAGSSAELTRPGFVREKWSSYSQRGLRTCHDSREATPELDVLRNMERDGALEGNQKPMEGKDSGKLVATRVRGLVSLQSLEVEPERV
jgi:hypothetical protein